MVIELGGLTEGEIIKELGIMECGHGINFGCPGGQAVGEDKRQEAVLKQVELIIPESHNWCKGCHPLFPIFIRPSARTRGNRPTYSPVTGLIPLRLQEESKKLHCRSYRAYDVYIRIKQID